MVSTAIDPHAPFARWRPVIAARRDRLLPWALMITSAWLVGGGYLDGWAHSHGKVDQSFFTPGTPLLYAGYGLSLVGTLMFAAGGAQAHTAWRDVTQLGVLLRHRHPGASAAQRGQAC